MSFALSDIRPFVRRIGIANGLVQNHAVMSYDHRLFIPLQDGGILQIGDKDCFIKKTEVYLLAPGVPYRVALAEGQKLVVINFDWTQNCLEQRNLILSVEPENFDNNKIIEHIDWSLFFPKSASVVLQAPYTVLAKACDMAECFYKPFESEKVHEMLLSGMFLQLLADLIENRGVIHTKAEEIYHYLCENYDKPITLETLSKQFHFHATYINRMLTKQYGQSFKKLVIHIRLKQSVVLLENSSLSIQEIASRLGFYDQKHFSQYFKKYYGVTPTQYRK